MTITPHAKRPDWFVVPFENVKHLAAVPAIKPHGFDQSRVEIPRSMLPLFDAGRAFIDAELIENNREFQKRCEARNDTTTPRGFLLRPHQHVGVEFARRRRGVLIADQPRTGKTAGSLAIHAFEGHGKLVVIVPISTREVWRGWVQRIFPDASVSVITGKTFDRSRLQADVVIGHYDILSAWQDASLKIGTLILDEAHVISNRRSQRTNAVAFVASRADRVITLTGTPLWNKPQQLWPLLGITAPGQFGGFHEFAQRYTIATPSAFGFKYEDTAHEEELKSRLTEIMLNRRWKDIAPDLPPVTRDTLLVDMTPQQRLDADLAAEAARSATGTSTAVGAIAKYRAVLGSIKVAAAVEATRNDLDRGERVVLWAWHKNTAKVAYDALRKKYPAFLVTGAFTPTKRDEILDQWRNTPGAALVITIAVGQVGIDLSQSHLAIFAEVDFTPALIAQAEMRTFSPLRPMNVRYIVADHPVEHAIIDALRSKLDNSDKIGVPAAEAAIDVLKNAFALPENHGDLDRLLRDLISAANTDG